MAPKTSLSLEDLEPEMMKVNVGEKKWDNINLNDFRTSSCWLPVAYGYLWIGLIISVVCYCVDIYLCINLLAFNQWSGQIQPAIPLSIAKWIFTGCIILSLLILIYEWIRAIRVMKRGYIADSYLDPLAVRVQCIRLSKNGRGWRRFLVFGQLTKSKKGAEYVAIFTYFSFKAWIRILFAEGPRMVINALTIKALVEGHLLPEGSRAGNQGHSPVAQFFVNFSILYQSSPNQAIVLLGMAWVALIWVIGFISFVLAILMYMLFLWHYIPTSLTLYLRGKIEGRVDKIVMERMKKVRRKETERFEKKAAKTGGRSTPVPGNLSRATTGTLDDPKTGAIPLLNRSATSTSQVSQSNPPSYTSRPSTPPATTADRKAAFSQFNSHQTTANTPGSAMISPNTSILASPVSGGSALLTRMNTQNSTTSNLSNATTIRAGTQISSYSNNPLSPMDRPGTADSFTTARSRPFISRQGTMDPEFGPNPYLNKVSQPSDGDCNTSLNGLAGDVIQPRPTPIPRSASASPYSQGGMISLPRSTSAGPLSGPTKAPSAYPSTPLAMPDPADTQLPPCSSSAAPFRSPANTQARSDTSPLSRPPPMDYFGPAPTNRSFTAPPASSQDQRLPYTMSPPPSRTTPIPRPGTAGGAFAYPEKPKPPQRGWSNQSSNSEYQYNRPAPTGADSRYSSVRRTQTYDDYRSNTSGSYGYQKQGVESHSHYQGYADQYGGVNDSRKDHGFRFDAI